ncbi:hypothetical protein D3C87_1305680 [compost metagenome]
MVPPKLKATQATATKKRLALRGTNSSSTMPARVISWAMVMTRMRDILSERMPSTRRPPRLAMAMMATALAATTAGRPTIFSPISLATPMT